MKCRCGRRIIRGNWSSTGGHYYHPNCIKMRELGWKEGYEAYYEMNQEKLLKKFRKKTA